MGKRLSRAVPSDPPHPVRGGPLAAVLAAALGLAACGTPQPLPTGPGAEGTALPAAPSTAPGPQGTASAPSGTATTDSATTDPAAAGPLTDPSQFQSPPARAVAILKTSANWYRDRFDQGHQYLVAGDTDRFELWWNIMNQGSLLATAQTAFGDASDVYGGNEPQQVDDWSVIMGDQGELQAAANAWHASQAEADYAKVLAALDHADRTIDALAPGITIPRSHGKIAVPMPYVAPRS
ncbi:hypothetical protein SA2016_2025 [Sinomonas atrocyanea]|uniref:Lipoprotein n=1 Tax=Sinomonas atrocyanea TaxID=37927 RepID=A0A126ZZS6_9MICC|nr:hypothetical protein [Sinomonas atrocyanea]AMM32698.1 hypothetical protein SA2016_2025 [Sinomonas atrocyanea]GEB62735.1 hypothetical protein SAT01_01830 [Sinomonas atrocyanea]GGG62164.1 hypothetical protein GCM10007172_11670 [Sinomonas atrocyanea]